MNKSPSPRPFALGRVVATPGALESLERNHESPATYLRRHQQGDWGNLGNDDWEANNDAIAHEGDPEQQSRVLSAYRLADETKIWIITEWDRSVTTILLPEDY